MPITRRTFLATGTAAAAPFSASRQTASAAVPSSGTAFPLNELTIGELTDRMSTGELSSEAITKLYLSRIEEIDRNGPTLRSILEVNPDAIEIARSLDVERKTKGPRGPLHGIPILLKDNIDTGDRMQTTAGSLALAGKPASADAFVAVKLRAAGAVLLGKTNLSEWANWRSTHSTSGWSGRGGLTRNPYALDRNPCGSSSGSGVAVSANLAAAAIGTETDGSVVCPSAINGIVGIKPTLGNVSRSGIVPIASSQDTAGPMARTVRDAAILLGVMTGVDAADPASAVAGANAHSDYTPFLDPAGLHAKKIGVARQYFKICPAAATLIEQCLELMRQAGATVIDNTDLPEFEPWRDHETLVLQYEFKAQLNAYLARRDAPLKTLADCIAFNRANARAEMPYFAQELMEASQEKGSLDDNDYKKALAESRRMTRKDGIDRVLSKWKLDAIVAPTAGPAFLTDLICGDKMDGSCSSPAAVAGYPHITVPAGFVFGLPVGISFFGAAWSEPKLLAMAYAFEQARRARRPPSFLATANLGT
jgi:amidase